MHSTFCRITGHARNLPKPNYFPLIPPISPADAKKLCRITGRSSKESHSYIPVIEFGKGLVKNSCKITKKSEGNKRHSYIATSTRINKSIGCKVTEKKESFGNYRYVFPNLDFNDCKGKSNYLQQILEKLETEINNDEKIKRFVYTIKSESNDFINLVVPSKLEHAIRAGEIENLMLSKTADHLKVQLKQGKTEEIVIRMAQESEMEEIKESLYEGEGQSHEVLKKQKKQVDSKKKRKSSLLASKKHLFEEKEREGEEREPKAKVVCNTQKAVKDNKAENCFEDTKEGHENESKVNKSETKSQLEGFIVEGDKVKQTNDLILQDIDEANRQTANLIPFGVNWRDIYEADKQNGWDWRDIERMCVESVLPSVGLQTCHLNSIPHLKTETGAVEITPEFKHVPVSSVSISKSLMDATVQLNENKSFVEAIHKSETIMMKTKDFADLLPNLSNMSYVICGMDSENSVIGHVTRVDDKLEFYPYENKDINVDCVTGQMIQMDQDKLFVPGQAVTTKDGITFVAGRAISTDRGVEFIPGQTVTDKSGQIVFIPGQLSGEEAKTFTPGITDTEKGDFIPGQYVDSKGKKVFMRGRMIDVEGSIKFLPGLECTDTQGNTKLIPGQVTDPGSGVSFKPGVTYLNEAGETVFMTGTGINLSGQERFIPGIVQATEKGELCFNPGYMDPEKGFQCGHVIQDGQASFLPESKMTKKKRLSLEIPPFENDKKASSSSTPSSPQKLDHFSPKLLPECGWELKEGEIGYMLKGEEKVEFLSESDFDHVTHGSQALPVMKTVKDGEVKFIPGKKVQTNKGNKFVPGQVVQTSKGEQFIPGRVIKTGNETKFVPGQVIETPDGPKFVLGQVIDTSNGSKFVPGQIIETKFGPTFVPGQVVETNEGTKFMPGQIVETSDGPKFLPGQLVENELGVKFVPGQAIDTDDGLRYLPPDLDTYEDSASFSLQGFDIAAEEVDFIHSMTCFVGTSDQLRCEEVNMDLVNKMDLSGPTVDVNGVQAVLSVQDLNISDVDMMKVTLPTQKPNEIVAVNSLEANAEIIKHISSEISAMGNFKDKLKHSCTNQFITKSLRAGSRKERNLSITKEAEGPKVEDCVLDKSLHTEMLQALKFIQEADETSESLMKDVKGNLMEYLRYVASSQHIQKSVVEQAKIAMKNLSTSDGDWNSFQLNIQSFSTKLEEALQVDAHCIGEKKCGKYLNIKDKVRNHCDSSEGPSNNNDNKVDMEKTGESDLSTDIKNKKDVKVVLPIENEKSVEPETFSKMKTRKIEYHKAKSFDLEETELLKVKPILFSLETPSVSIVEALIDLSHATTELSVGTNRLKELRWKRRLRKENQAPPKSKTEMITQLATILDYVPDENGVSFSTVFQALAKEESSLFTDVLKQIVGKVDRCKDDLEALTLLRDAVINVVSRNCEKKVAKIMRKIDDNPFTIRTEHYLKRHIELCTALSYFKELDSVCEVLCESFKDPRSLKDIICDKAMTHLLMEVNTMVYLENANPEFNSFFDRFVLDPHSSENSENMKYLLREIDSITGLSSVNEHETQMFMSLQKALPDAIRSSKDIPCCVLEYLKESPDNAQKFVEQILGKARRETETPSDSGYCSDGNGRYALRGQATVILKGHIQTIIPRNMARAILAGRASYTLIDEEGIKYFRASSAMSSKLTQGRWKNYGIFKDPIEETSQTLNRVDSGVISKPESGKSSVSKQSSFETEDSSKHSSPGNDSKAQSFQWSPVPEVSGC